MGHSRIRITFNPDGTIIANYVPGDAYLSYWIDQMVPLNNWRPSGVGINLQCSVTPKQADYLERLATCYHETPCPVVGREHIERMAACYQDSKHGTAPAKQPDQISVSPPELTPGEQLSLF